VVTGSSGVDPRPRLPPADRRPRAAGSVTAVPELPEVESVRRQLAPALVGRRIVDAWADPHPGTRLSDVTLAVGRRIGSVDRRGKFLLCPLDPTPEGRSLELVLHLGMTGAFHLVPTPPAGTDPDGGVTHVRVRFLLDDGTSLLFRDPRRFGRVSVVPLGEHGSIPTLARLGPEPLSAAFDPERFAAGLAATHAPVKARLLDQRLVAGVGNIYADETLWRARIHPASRRVGRRRAFALHAAIREVLAAAIEREGTTFRDYRMVNGASGRYASFLDAYGQATRPCARCGTPLRRTVVAQRGTTYCPRCQRA
jgi:formamidopyrimidine-DNA glycosylase